MKIPIQKDRKGFVTTLSGRSLRPPVCSCPLKCRSQEEMKRWHGTPDAFTDSLADAVGEGIVSFAEAERANLIYREEWAQAPEKTEVDKS